jgi:hypothetical protein
MLRNIITIFDRCGINLYMKHLLFFWFVIESISLSAQKNNCTVVFHVRNADSTYFAYFQDEDRILYLDTLAEKTDSFSVYVPEPTGITMIVENDTSRRLEFYIYEGRLEIEIDAINTQLSRFVNSPFNQEYVMLRRKMDSIQSMVYTPEAIERIRHSGVFSPIRDSIRKIFDNHMDELDNQLYHEGFSHTGSFHTLLFINFWLQKALLKDEDTPFSKKQLKLLFDKLDTSLQKYPTYKKCIEMFQQKTDIRPKINQAIYKY